MQRYGKKIGIYLEENDKRLKWGCNIIAVGWHEARCIVKIEINKLSESAESSIIINSVLGNSKEIREISQ